MTWESVIGLEIHAQLATKSKIFSGASCAYGAEPNTQACAVDLGLPGVLPVLNAEAVRMAITFGLAIDAKIPRQSVFARKNYFYPDLPKGYQISQFELPIVAAGEVMIEATDGSTKCIGVTRAHLEEDAGKSVHDAFDTYSGIDLNRAGTPLLEIVSEPHMANASEAVAYMRKIHEIVRFVGVCDGNMQEGSFRCDANVSVRQVGDSELGTRTEIKNLNSFRFVEKAINYEIERQIESLERGESIHQETRLYDANTDSTRAMRSKEEANDYRYFPDPDLLPVVISDTDIEQIRAELPELPDQIRARFVETYGLSAYDAQTLSASPYHVSFFDGTVSGKPRLAKLAANWIMGELTSALNTHEISIQDSPISPIELTLLLERIDDQTLSGKLAKQVFEAMWRGEGTADEIIQRDGLQQVTDETAIDALIETVVAENPDQVAQYLQGKTKVMGYLVGAVMKASNGKANPKSVNELIRSKLDSI